MNFDDGLSFLEPHKTIRRAVRYDGGQTAEVSWAFICELPPKAAKRSAL